MIHCKFKTGDGSETTIYGWLTSEGVVEAFATNPHCAGASEGRRGKIHRVTSGFRLIEQSEFNCAFLSAMPDEIEDKAELTMSLGELEQRYPDEEAQPVRRPQQCHNCSIVIAPEDHCWELLPVVDGKAQEEGPSVLAHVETVKTPDGRTVASDRSCAGQMINSGKWELL